MRKFSVLCFIVSVGAMTTFAQTASDPTKDSAAQDQKLYFPASYYADSPSLSKAIPKLAERILAAYHENDERTYYNNSICSYLLTENYTRAIDLIDSVRKIDGDSSYSIDLKSYSLAKIAEQKHKGSFETVFKKEYTDAFDKLSFRNKVNAAMADTSWIRFGKEKYMSTKEELLKHKNDSLNLEESRSLCDNFFYYCYYSKIIPLMLPLIDAQYRQTFPAIKSVGWAGVLPVERIDEMPDPNVQYKLLFELTGFAHKGQDSTAKTGINEGLGSVARELNLHEANGIPRKNINAVIVAHASVLYCFLTNEKYQKKYGIDNPNIPLIKELQDYGVKILVCGQAMFFFDVEMKDLVPGISQVLTAKTVISSYQLKGYVYHNMSLKE
jgi:intracellular sulfur oxidation DsrE/DsrF family protein